MALLSKFYSSILCLISILGASILLFWFHNSPSDQRQIMSDSNYYGITLLIFAWIYALLRLLQSLHFDVVYYLKSHRIGILSCFALCFMVSKSIKPQLRVLSDETNLLSVSHSLLQKKNFSNSTMGKYYYDRYHSISDKSPIRPILFPYLVHLGHLVLGFSPNNLYIINLICLFLILLLTFTVIKHYSGNTYAIACCLGLCSYPIISLCTQSGGFDICSLLFLIISLFALQNELYSPSRNSFLFLCLSLCMYGYIRYENLMLIGICGLCFLVRPQRLKEVLKNDYHIIVLCIAILIPRYFQMYIASGKYQNKGSLLSYYQFKDHFLSMLNAQLQFDFLLPFNNLFNILGCVGLLLALVKIRSLTKKDQILCLAAISMFMAKTIIFLSHFLGRYTTPTSARFYIVFSYGMNILAIYCLYMLFRNHSKKWLIAVSTLMLLLYHPVAVNNKHLRSLTLPRMTEYAIEYLSQINHKNFIIISDRPGIFTAHSFGAVSFKYINANPQRFKKELDKHLYEFAIVIQKISYSSQSAIQNTKLDAELPLETVKEIQVSNRYFLRMSKISTSAMPPASENTEQQ